MLDLNRRRCPPRQRAARTTRRGRILLLAATAALVSPTVRADIFQWEYNNPADPSQGTHASTTLCTDGSGVTAQAGVDLSFRNLNRAFLVTADLSPSDPLNPLSTRSNLFFTSLDTADATDANFSYAILSSANLFNANMTGANLTNAQAVGTTFSLAVLANATFTGANIATADFSNTTALGFTIEQLQTTASYQIGDLKGIRLRGNNISTWDLDGKSLTAGDLSSSTLTSSHFAGAEVIAANFSSATLTGATFNQANAAAGNFSNSRLLNTHFGSTNLASANLSSATLGTATQSIDLADAYIASVNFSNTTGARGFTQAQLSSSGSYQLKDLHNINFSSNDLSTFNFTDQDLTGVNFTNATLKITGGSLASTADFSGANIASANFTSATSKGFTRAQLESTASYANKNLRGVNFASNAFATASPNSGWNFGTQDLSYVNFSNATLGVGGNLAAFDGATVNFTNFSSTTSRGFGSAQLASTASYGSLNLQGINLGSNNLAGWNLTNQDLTGANFSSATFSGLAGPIQLSGATITSANFTSAVAGGLTKTMLETTANFLVSDLRGIGLGSNNLVSGNWNLSNLNLSSANFNSATLGNATLSAGALVSLTGSNLTSATLRNAFMVRVNLNQANASSADFSQSNLGSADFGTANLTGANFSGATLTSANFNNAIVANANFTGATAKGFIFNQLSPTLSYQNKDLHGIKLGSNDLSTFSFQDIDVCNASFSAATLTGSNFASAVINGADFSNTSGVRGLTRSLIESTKSYAMHDLHGVSFFNDDLRQWDFTEQNLDSANLSNATFSDSAGLFNAATFTDAIITNANLTFTTPRGFTREMFESTNSYQIGDLHGINLSQNNLARFDPNNPLIPLPAWDLSQKNLTKASFASATLTNAKPDGNGGTIGFTVNFADSYIAGANFTGETSLGFTEDMLYSTASYVENDLRGISLASNYLLGWNFAGQNLGPLPWMGTVTKANFSDSVLSQTTFGGATLDGANFSGATLTNTVFTGASIVGANFNGTTSRGFNFDQLQSTTTYTKKALGNIGLGSNNLTGWDLHEQNLGSANLSYSMLRNTNLRFASLTGADLTNAGLINTDFTMADLRGSKGFAGGRPERTILPDGSIVNFHLDAGESLTLHDFDGIPGPTTGTFTPIPIRVTGSLTLDSDSSLTMVIKDSNYGSKIIFSNDTMELSGTLSILVDAAAVSGELAGHPIHLFDWYTPPSGNNQFDTLILDPHYPINADNLYIDGTVVIGGLYGDTNFDGRVDTTDLLNLANHWHQTAPPPIWEEGNFNGDGTVDTIDLGLLAANWQVGTGAIGAGFNALASSLGLPVNSVPEPASGAFLFGLSLAGILARRRRQR